MTIDDIRKKMHDRKIVIVAHEIGISKTSLYNYLKGKTDLSLSAYLKLIDYLKG